MVLGRRLPQGRSAQPAHHSRWATPSGPTTNAIRACSWTSRAASASSPASDGGYSNNAACVGGGTFSYGAMAWRYMEKDFRMRSTYGAVEGSTLEDWPIAYEDLEPYYEKAEWEMGVSGDDMRQPVQRSPPAAAAHAAASAQPGTQILLPAAEAARTASIPHPDAAQHRAVQRAPGVHALPVVRGLCLRSERAHRNPQHRDPRCPRHRQLRTAHGVHDEGGAAGRPGRARPASPISMRTTGSRSNRPTS